MSVTSPIWVKPAAAINAMTSHDAGRIHGFVARTNMRWSYPLAAMAVSRGTRSSAEMRVFCKKDAAVASHRNT